MRLCYMNFVFGNLCFCWFVHATGVNQRFMFCSKATARMWRVAVTKQSKGFCKYYHNKLIGNKPFSLI